METCRAPLDGMELSWPCQQPHRSLGNRCDAYVSVSKQRERTTVSQQPCRSSSAGEQQVAWCAAGLTRALLDPPVFHSLLHNGIDALGGRASLFLQLKMFDTMPKKPDNSFPSGAAADILSQKSSDAVVARVLKMVRYLQPQALSFVTTVDEDNSHTNAKCTLRSATKMPSNLAYATPAGVQRHVGQLRSSVYCWRTITAHEEAHRIRYDFVVRTRPDVAILQPLAPLCTYSPFLQPHHRPAGGAAPLQHAVLMNGKDFMQLMHRKLAGSVLQGPFATYAACRGVAWWHGVFEHLVRNLSARAGGGVGNVNICSLLPVGIIRPSVCTGRSCATLTRAVVDHHIADCSRFCSSHVQYRVGTNGAWHCERGCLNDTRRWCEQSSAGPAGSHARAFASVCSMTWSKVESYSGQRFKAPAAAAASGSAAKPPRGNASPAKPSHAKGSGGAASAKEPSHAKAAAPPKG